MSRITLALAGALLLASCGAPEPEAAPEPQAAATPEPPPDESRRFPKEGQTAMELINDQLLGKDYLPGGNLATYEKDGKTYQQFLITTSSAEAAGLLAFEAKGQLTDPKFVASFGGYFGLDGETPWFIFPKTNHLLGVVGLPQDEADLVARDFAARVE